MLAFAFVACIMVMAVKAGPIIVKGDSCTTEMMVTSGQCTINCLRTARAEETTNNTAVVMLKTSDCIVGCFEHKGSNPNRVDNIHSDGLLDVTTCNNKCYNELLTSPTKCKYLDYMECLTNCLLREVNKAANRRQRRRRATSDHIVSERVMFLGIYLDCITPEKVLERNGKLPIPTNPGCSVRDLLKVARCKNNKLNAHFRGKRDTFSDAAKDVPSLVNLMHSHCLSGCLKAPETTFTPGECYLLDLEQFEFCVNKCILKKTLTLPAPPAPAPPAGPP